MKSILVVGGNGFIGSHLVDRLTAMSRPVVILDKEARRFGSLPDGVKFVRGNSGDTGLVDQLLEENHVDTVYHLGWSTIHETATRFPEADVSENIAGSISLLAACCRMGVRRFIFVSSGGTVYGLPKTESVNEEHPTNPINAYGISKLSVEKYVQMYNHLLGLEYVIVRPSVVYGPRQDPHRGQSAVCVFIDRALRCEPITVFGDGSAVRDYFYVDDMMNALISAMTCPSGMIFNLAGDKSFSLLELVRLIETILGVKIYTNYQSQRKIDVPIIRLDTSRARTILNWTPSVPLRNGIIMTADWLRTLHDSEQ